jgi:peptide/nickel transport system permease protein
MIDFFLKKSINAVAALFGVVTLIFFLFTVLPGDPVQMMLGQNENINQINNLKKKHGFDLSKKKQYLFYINDISPISIHSNKKTNFTFYKKAKYGGFVLFYFSEFYIVLKFPYLRTSFQKSGKAVSEIIGETLPNTFVLALSSICIATLLGVFTGIIAAIYNRTIIDKLLQFFCTLGMSVPSFFSAILFSWFFGFILNRYTNLNMTGSLFELDDYGESSKIVLKNLILPAFVLGIRPLSVIIQLMRSSMIDVLSKEYIKTAKSKGLSGFKIILNHCIKNSLNPVITVLSGWFASLLAGSIFVEYIFGWKGLGKEIIDALNYIDIPVIMGATFVIAFLFIIINIAVDIIHSYLDPQIKYF